MRIAIVNDSRMAVEALRRVVTSVAGYEIAWIAWDGEEAARKCATDVPDVVLMDLMMPRMDGAEASRHIMRDSPCAILVVTATVEGHAPKVFEAMGWGALDAVNTPVLGVDGDPAGGAQLLAKIAMLAKLIGKPRRPRLGAVRRRLVVADPMPELALVAIGASTGGPKALVRVLTGLPPEFRAAITIVQHIDEQFARGLASWLAGETSREVRVIRQDDRPTEGVCLAASNDHLVLTPELNFAYTNEPVDYPYRPSVDVFFQAVAKHWPGQAVGVQLTGMGADGAQGLLAMRRVGWHTIAQDEESSIVYGMPKAAAQLDAAVEILPLDRIGEAIGRAVAVAPSPSQRSRS